MARLVIRNRDKVNTDCPYLDAQCTKRGFVVDILNDGQSVGKVGETYDGWTVVEVPGATREQLSAYLAAEPGDRLQNRMLQRRAFWFDLDAWGIAGKPALSLMIALGFKRAVTPKQDPNVLGDAGSVL